MKSAEGSVLVQPWHHLSLLFPTVFPLPQRDSGPLSVGIWPIPLLAVQTVLLSTQLSVCCVCLLPCRSSHQRDQGRR